ncbi:MAG: hypothetical protein Q9172_006562 [Xanthocarpia lactea]
MIITIPVSLLWKVKMPLGQKLALMGIFSLTIFVMLISIIRVAVTKTSATRQADQTWLFIWANVEMGVAIIISCIASFRQLFMKQSKARDTPPAAQPHWIRQKLLSNFKFRFALPSIHPSTFKVSFARNTQSDARVSVTSTDCIVPLDNVYVSHEMGVSSEAMKAGNYSPVSDAYGSSYQIYGQTTESALGSAKW